MIDETNEIEVEVRAIDDSATASAQPLIEGVRKLFLAGIGALALTRDEADAIMKRLVERGEVAQKDGEKAVRELTTRIRPQAEAATSEVQSQALRAEAQLESGFEQLLNRLNIPSKRDIDDLTSKIARLSSQVDELRHEAERPTRRAPQVAPE